MQQLSQQVEACFQQAESFYQRSFARPEVVLSSRRSKVAGSANLTRWRLRFNAHFYRQQPQAFLAQTVPHEVAHLICHAVHGQVKPHGKEWQTLMQQVFHCSPTTTHRYSLAPLDLATVRYHCQCQSHQLGLRRHNKVFQGVRYQCKRCRHTLIVSDTRPSQSNSVNSGRSDDLSS